MVQSLLSTKRMLLIHLLLYERSFNTVASPSPTTALEISTGRRRRPKSWNTADQNSKVDLKLGNSFSPCRSMWTGCGEGGK